MFGLSFGEILLLSGIGLIVLGPKQLPLVARALGKTAGELKKAFREVADDFMTETKNSKDSPSEKSPGKPSESSVNQDTERSIDENKKSGDT